MAEYHVGCGIAGIYAGTVKANGYEWRNKSDVTTEALNAERIGKNQYKSHREEVFRRRVKRKH